MIEQDKTHDMDYFLSINTFLCFSYIMLQIISDYLSDPSLVLTEQGAKRTILMLLSV